METLNSGVLNFPRGISLLEFMRASESSPCPNYPYFFGEFSSCHHCKLLFHKTKLIKCNYSSASMGLPSYSKNSKPFYMVNSKVNTNKLLRKAIRKRTYEDKKKNSLSKIPKGLNEFNLRRNYL